MPHLQHVGGEHAATSVRQHATGSTQARVGLP